MESLQNAGTVFEQRALTFIDMASVTVENLKM